MVYSNSWSRFVSCSFLADLIQLYGMDLGKLLCFCQKAPLGEPRIYAWSDASALWFRSNGCSDHDDSGQR